MVLNHLDGLGNGCRSCGIAQAPSGHGVALGEAVDGDGQVVQFRTEGGDADVPGVPVYEVFVNFISQDEDVFAQGHFSQGAQFFYGPGRIVRGSEDDHLGAGGHGFLKLFGGKLPSVFRRGFHDDGDASAHADHFRIADPVRSGDDDFIPLGYGCHDGVETGVLGAGSHGDLGEIVFQVVFPLELFCDGLAECGKTGGRRIFGGSVVQGRDGCLLDVFRGVHFRFTACQTVNFFTGGFHSLGPVGHLEGQGRGQCRNAGGNHVHCCGAVVDFDALAENRLFSA